MSNESSHTIKEVDGIRNKNSLEKLNLFHSIEVLFPEYFQSISRIFPYYGIGTLGARGFLREEPRSAISEAVKREKIDEVRKPLVARDS